MACLHVCLSTLPTFLLRRCYCQPYRYTYTMYTKSSMSSIVDERSEKTRPESWQVLTTKQSRNFWLSTFSERERERAPENYCPSANVMLRYRYKWPGPHRLPHLCAGMDLWTGLPGPGSGAHELRGPLIQSLCVKSVLLTLLAVNCF